MSSTEPLPAYRAGIVGCGRIGTEFAECHASAYRDADEVDLVALADLDPTRLQAAGAKWAVTNLYPDFRAILAAHDLDILSIATGASTHLAIAGEAIKSGIRAIYCEKPITASLAQADQLIRRCHDAGVILQINHQRRFSGLYRGLQQFLAQGGLGNLQQARFDYTRGIANTGSHMFDLLRFLLGEVAWVEASYSKYQSRDAKDPNLDADLGFSGGLTCQIRTGPDQSRTQFEIAITGNAGSLALRNNGADIDYRTANPGQPDGLPFQWDSAKGMMVGAVEHLVKCMRQHAESVSSGEEGRASLELICACHASAEAGGERIQLPLENRSKVIHSS